MPKWLVQIAGSDSDLKDLIRVLTLDDMHIVAENNKYYLSSTKFDQCETAAEVWSIADEIFVLLSGIVRLVLGSRNKLIRNSLLKINDNGTREKIISIHDTMYVSSKVSITALLPSKLDKKELDLCYTL
jgi:hypothetical protein